MRLRFLAPVLAPILATIAHAHTVWIVDASGGGDFLDLPDAVAAAMDGDVLLVKDGSYSRLTILDKALAVVADEGAHAVVNGVNIRNLGAKKSFLLRGLDVLEQGAQSLDCVHLTNNNGAIWVEDCIVRFSTDYPLFGSPGTGVLVGSCKSVTLVDCDVRGGTTLDASMAFLGQSGKPALDVGWSRVVAHRTTFTGGKGPPASWVDIFGGWLNETGKGGPAVYVDDGGEVFLYDCAFVGGDGGDAAIVQEACHAGEDGAPAIRLTNTGTSTPDPLVLIAASTMQGGQPGDDGGLACGTGVAGPESVVEAGQLVPIPVVGATREVSAPAIVREGETLVLTSDGGAPLEQVLVGVGISPATAMLPEFENAIVLLGPIIVFALGPMPASGPLTASFPVPDLPASWQGVPLYLQSLHVGVGVHLGTGSAVVVLDAP